MYRRGFFIRFVLALVLIVVILVGGYFAYRTGWSQGYQAAALQAGSEGQETGALMPLFRGFYYAPYVPGFGFPFFGLCFGIGFIFLVLFLIRGIFRPWGWRHWGRQPHHGPWKYGPMPPWGRDWEASQRKSSKYGDEAKESQEDQPAAI